MNIPTKEEVWMRAYCATANANDCKSTKTAITYADAAIGAYQERFPAACLSFQTKAEEEKREREKLRSELAEANQQYNELETRYENLKTVAAISLDPASVRKAINDEPELPGDMPPDMWELIKNDQDAITKAMRIVCRETKSGILKRLNL